MKVFPSVAIAFLVFAMTACLENETPPELGALEQNPQTMTELPPAPSASPTEQARQIEENWNLISFPVGVETNIASFISSHSLGEKIRSVWKWDLSNSTWLVYPQMGNFNELQTVSPHEGYWVRSSEAFTLNGQGVSQNSYDFVQEWNLVGYSHSASSNQSISDFFSAGNFWATSCETGSTVNHIWAWLNGGWALYFPGDTSSNHPGLDAFNSDNNSSFPALTTLEPGMGMWVNAARASTVTECGGGTSTMAVTNLGSAKTFSLPNNTISFALHAWGSTSNNLYVYTVNDPSGQDTFEPVYPIGHYGKEYSNALYPMIPSMETPSGNWSFTTENSTSHQLTVRTGTTPTSSVLVIQPYLTGTKFSVAEIQPALDGLKSIYEGAGLQVIINPTESVSGGQYSTVNVDYYNATTTALVSRGAADTVNLFFAQDLYDEDNLGGGFLGIAPAIPGSLGVAGKFNGVLIGLEAHLFGGTFYTDVLAETAAHEMGHWLGLFHTTERSGDSFDPLGDTPECHQNPAEPTSCADGGNLMFWTAGSIRQTTLSSDQSRIINYSPIAR